MDISIKQFPIDCQNGLTDGDLESLIRPYDDNQDLLASVSQVTWDRSCSVFRIVVFQMVDGTFLLLTRTGSGVAVATMKYHPTEILLKELEHEVYKNTFPWKPYKHSSDYEISP